MVSPTIDRRFGLVGNASIKAPVLVVATGNITLSGEQTIDGNAVSHLNASSVPARVLCVGQTDATQNGIYDVSTAAWSRSADADGIYDFVKGSTVFVTDGTVGAGSYWQLTTTGSIDPGTTAMTWISVLVGINTALAAANVDAAAAHVDRVQADADAVATGLDRVATANYAAAAATGAKFYNTIALGNAGVADAATFGVIAGGADGLTRPTIYRRESAGVSTALYSVLPASEYDALLPALSGVTPVWALADDKGNSAIEVASDGTTSLAAATIPSINGFSVRASLRPSNAGTFDGELVYFNNTGQSLASGPLPSITNAQEADNLGYAFWAVSPVATVTLTAANCAQTSSGLPTEPPLFGALYYIKVLLAAENGLAYTAHKFQLVGADNSHGSFSILSLNKGTSLYNGAISQALSTKTIADAANLISLAGGTFWTQGEADTAMSAATYQGYLSTLATDYNTDYKAQTGQTKDAPFVTYQTGSTPGSSVALGQLAASLSNSLIRLACAMYVFEYQDNLHINAESSRWLGCYYGLVWKRVMVDGATWSPLRPTASTGTGKKYCNITFNVPVKPLVLDTTQVPSQSQSGFTLVDSGGTNIPILTVTVVAPDKVKITTTANIPAGAKLRYGFVAATGKGVYVGGAGNLRDCQGDSVPLFESHRLDNWCVIFELAL